MHGEKYAIDIKKRHNTPIRFLGESICPGTSLVDVATTRIAEADAIAAVATKKILVRICACVLAFASALLGNMPACNVSTCRSSASATQ